MGRIRSRDEDRMKRRDFVRLGSATMIAAGAGRVPTFGEPLGLQQVLGPPQHLMVPLEPKANERAADFTLQIAPMIVELSRRLTLCPGTQSGQRAAIVYVVSPPLELELPPPPHPIGASCTMQARNNAQKALLNIFPFASAELPREAQNVYLPRLGVNDRTRQGYPDGRRDLSTRNIPGAKVTITGK